MPRPSRAHHPSRTPSRVALALGIGVLSAAGVGATAMAAPSSQANAALPAGMVVWIENGRVFIAELGRETRELALGETAEAQRLRHLLERSGAVGPGAGVPLGRLILAGGGGNGFSWAPPGGAASPTAPAPAIPAAGRAPTSVPAAPHPSTTAGVSGPAARRGDARN